MTDEREPEITDADTEPEDDLASEVPEVKEDPIEGEE